LQREEGQGDRSRGQPIDGGRYTYSDSAQPKRVELG
jgi:hypothetical protein